MKIASHIEGDVLILTLKDEVLDASHTQNFKREVISTIDNAHLYQVIFDLSELKFIDSSGLGSFLFTLRHLNEHGGDLKLTGISTTVRAMFQIVRMHRLFDIFPTVNEAIDAFRAAPA